MRLKIKSEATWRSNTATESERPKAHAARSSWIIGQGGSAGWECRLDNGVDAEPIHVTERREYGETRRNSGLRACLEGCHEPVE